MNNRDVNPKTKTTMKMASLTIMNPSFVFFLLLHISFVAVLSLPTKIPNPTTTIPATANSMIASTISNRSLRPHVMLLLNGNGLDDESENTDVVDDDGDENNDDASTDFSGNSNKKDDDGDDDTTIIDEARVFESTVLSRHACTRFRRYAEPLSLPTDSSDSVSGNNDLTPTPLRASIPDPTVINQSLQCLDLSRRAPSGFNVQPYRLLAVSDAKGREQLAKHCIGRNADRVRDCDMAVLFLADRQCVKDGGRLNDLVIGKLESTKTKSMAKAGTTTAMKEDDVGSDSNKKKMTKTIRRRLRKLRILVLLFSSGWPLPRPISTVTSFGIRTGVSILAFLLRKLNIDYPLPTLQSADAWSTKNVSMVAMTYMLACASRKIDTCPMEGYNSSGIRRSMGISSRYGLPLIVVAGTSYDRKEENSSSNENVAVVSMPTDDAGMGHGTGDGATLRFPSEDIVFHYDGKFGTPARIPPRSSSY